MTAGSLLVMVKKEVAALAELSFEGLVLGRAARAVLQHAGGEVRVWNVRNLEIDASHADAVASRIERHSEWASADFLRRVALLLGDFDISGAGPNLSYELRAAHDLAASAGPHRRRWARAWSAYTKVSDGAPTHFTASSGFFSRLDRTFTIIPGWAMYSLTVRSELQADPAGCERPCSGGPQPAGAQHVVGRPAAGFPRGSPRSAVLAGVARDIGGVGLRRLGHRRLHPAVPAGGAQRVSGGARLEGEEVGQRKVFGSLPRERSRCSPPPRDAKMLVESTGQRWQNGSRCRGRDLSSAQPVEFADEVGPRRAAEQSGWRGAQRAERHVALRRL